MDKKLLLSDLKADVSEYDAKALGNAIRLLRENLKLKQEDLGELTGISTSEISKVETGNRVKVPLETLIKICPYLNVSLEYLLAACIPIQYTDKEHFFDYHGEEIDLYAIAKNIYSTDSELLLLFNSSSFLSNPRLIQLLKLWIHLHTTVTERNNETLSKMYYEFKNYCISFLETLSDIIDSKEQFYGKEI